MSQPPEISNGESESNKDPHRSIISDINHSRLGRVITFIDDIGLGVQIGEGEELFIVRPVMGGVIRVFAPTEAGIQKAKELYGRVIDARGGHN